MEKRAIETSAGPHEERPVERPVERARDRAATEARILDAAQRILTESGPAGLGVNALARAADVDKQLIYRYYGGLDGLLEALGERIAGWWQERLMEGGPETPPQTYGELVERLALRLLFILRTEPLALQSTLWELTDRTGLARVLSMARTRVHGAWMARTRGDIPVPRDIDAPAVNAMLIASISYTVLASHASDAVVGMPSKDDRTWERIEEAIVRLVRGVYGHEQRE
jgi:AcrR family transcriptional regulator